MTGRAEPHLGEFAQMVLLCLLRLGPSAYGTSIRAEIERRTGRDASLGAVYTTLDRLEEKGYVRSRVGEPTPERGGKRKRHYQLLPLGAQAIQSSYRAFKKMTQGLEQHLETS